jgi:twitching motility protein PilT
MDFRIVSIEDELKTVSLSSAMQARDFQALRAKVESLEAKSGGDVEDALTRVFDHVEAQDERIEQVFDRLQVLDGRLSELAERLDNLGDIGPIESLPGLLEQSLVTSLDDLEARLELKIESATRDSSGGSQAGEAQLQALRDETEEKIQVLRDSLERTLENRQEELLEMVQASAPDSEAEEFKESFTKQLDQIRNAVVELQEATESLPTREELDQVRSGLESSKSRDSSDDLTALAGEFAGLKDKLNGLSERVANLGEMNADGDWQSKLDELMKFSEEAGKHQEKVDEAMRLVGELEQKTKNLGNAPQVVPDDGLTPPPGETQIKLTLRDLVREMVKNRVSDLHIKTGRAITARIGRELIQFSTPPLSPADSYHLIASALRPSQRKRLVEERDIEFVYQYESIRLRANVFFDRGNISATFKMLSNRPPELENLGLPKAFSGLLNRGSGLVLVCGLPGSGRSTTLTASLDFLNRTKQLHLVSLEDRLDFTHEDRRSLVTQRELGSDIISFAQGTRRAIGQDSDVIFVSNLGTKDTMEAVFSAVDSGLLVVGAITAQSAEDAIPRLINLFPESERKMRARLFARALQGILSLKLFDRADGEGQIPASELLIADPTVKRLIETANLSALHRQIASGTTEGMQTFADSIERLVETGLIKAEAAKVELERMAGHAARAPVAAPPATPPAPSQPVARPPSQPPAPTPPPPPSSPSGASGSHSVVEPPPSPPSPPASQEPEAFGEEDTLMNWL